LLDDDRNARICAVAGAFTIGFSGVLIRLSHASPSTAAIYRCAYALPALGLLAWLERRRQGPRSWHERRMLLPAGVFFAVDLILWNHSIQDVGAGLSTVLANFQVVLVPVFAWVALDERAGARQLSALPISCLGVLMISGVLEHGAYGRDPTGGAAFGVAAGVAYAVFLLLLRHSGVDRPRPAGQLFDLTLVATVVCIVEGLIVGDAHFVPVWPGAAWLITVALSSQVLGWMLISTALPRLPATLGSLILTLTPVEAVIAAAIIFGESPSPLQLSGVLLVVVGLAIATLPRRRAPSSPEQIVLG
jgi:drug/metabolite transporter (DMT)-like permease